MRQTYLLRAYLSQMKRMVNTMATAILEDRDGCYTTKLSVDGSFDDVIKEVDALSGKLDYAQSLACLLYYWGEDHHFDLEVFAELLKGFKTRAVKTKGVNVTEYLLQDEDSSLEIKITEVKDHV